MKDKMLNYVKKGEITQFIQTWDDEKPRIECYSPNNLKPSDTILQSSERVGYGKLSITKDNVVHLWGGSIDKRHLEKYTRKMRKRNLKFRID